MWRGLLGWVVTVTAGTAYSVSGNVYVKQCARLDSSFCVLCLVRHVCHKTRYHVVRHVCHKTRYPLPCCRPVGSVFCV